MFIYEILLMLNLTQSVQAKLCGGGRGSGDIETSWLPIYFTIFLSILLVDKIEMPSNWKISVT
jgi:hypothetical protein